MSKTREVAMEIAGLKIDDRNYVINNTLPVYQRKYDANAVFDVVCYKDGKFQNVEYFSPVLYDKENGSPTYNPNWEVYDGDGKAKKLLQINYTKSYLRWWAEQRRRCIEGYTVGGLYLTGFFYFWLNFWRIKSKTIGEGYIAPRFMDIHKEIADLLERAQKEGKNLCILKRRQTGCSEFFAALAAWFYTFFESSHSLIVAGEDKYAEETMNKSIVGLEALSPIVKKAGREFYKRRIKDTPELIQSGYITNGVANGYNSIIQRITVRDSEEAANGKSPVYTLMEESGINPRLKKTFNKIQPAIEEQGKQHGRIIIVNGTGGAMEKSVLQMKDMFYNPKRYNMIEVPNKWDKMGGTCSPFFGGTYYQIMDYDGNSYHEASKEYLEKGWHKSDDKESLIDKKVAYPLTPSDAFTNKEKYLFNSEKLVNRYNDLQSMGIDEPEVGRLDWITDIKDPRKILGVKYTKSPEGKESELDADGDLKYPYIILEHPEKTADQEREHERLMGNNCYPNLYGGGTDSYDKDKAFTSDSVGSCAIFKTYLNSNTTSNLFVARVTIRPKTAEKFYDMTARLCYYYHKALNLIEYSNVAIFHWYHNNGFSSLLKERPLFAGAKLKRSRVANEYGIDPNSKHFWEEHFAEYIEKYCENFYDAEAVERLSIYRRNENGRKWNCDITISLMLAYENWLDFKYQSELIESNQMSDEDDKDDYVQGYYYHKPNGDIEYV